MNLPIDPPIGRRRRRALALAAAVLLLAVGCGPAATETPPGPSASLAAPSATAGPQATPPPTEAATAAVPGSIVVQPCPPVPSNTACLGQAPGTISLSAASGSTIAVLLVVHNPGGTPSSPITVLLYVLDAASPLPFDPPTCTTCSSTASRTVIGLEWPALAAGETRTVSVQIPVSGDAGPNQVFADLYTRPLADVVADEMASGITPGQQGWKVALAVTAP